MLLSIDEEKALDKSPIPSHDRKQSRSSVARSCTN